jgi:hypothetical protein
MNAAIRCVVSTLVALFVCLLGSGCGPKMVKPSGKILKDGQPFTLSPKGMFGVALIPADEKEGKEGYPATTKPDGTFEVTGKEGKGVPAGKYRFSVTAADPYPSKDLLLGHFQGAKSPLVQDVTSSDTPITIDVGKGGGGAKK